MGKTVTIVSLRPWRGQEGFVAPKTTLVVDERRANELVKKGLATFDVGEKSRTKAQQAAARNKAIAGAESNKATPMMGGPNVGLRREEPRETTQVAAGGEAAAESPTPENDGASVTVRRRGSRTGAAKPQSSSRQGRRRSK